MRSENGDRPVVYICSPFSGDQKTNTKRAKKYSRYAVDRGVIPFAPHLLLPMYMKEETERGQALYMDLVFLGRCDELWVFGNSITSGMQAEINKAAELGIVTRFFKEVPDEGLQHDNRE